MTQCPTGRRAALIACLAAGACAAAAARATEPARQRAAALVLDPPAVRAVTLQRITPPSTVRVQVTFAPDKRLGREVLIGPPRQPMRLRDDGTHGDAKAGDHIYAGTTQIDVKALGRDAAHLEERLHADPQLTMPLFLGRQIVKHLRVRGFDFATFLSGGPVKLKAAGLCGFSKPFLWQKSLLINDPAVVTDPTRSYVRCSVGANPAVPGGPLGAPNGVWTFEHLVRQMVGTTATDAQVSDVLSPWLSSWTSNATVNGWNVIRRPNAEAQILAPWRAASAPPGTPPAAGGTYDVRQAPFQLLAIVNRIDKAAGLAFSPGMPGSGPAGELRFVFGALSAQCSPLKFTVIFEYQVTKSGCDALADWAQRWIDLSDATLTPAQYAAKLQALTEEVVSGGAGTLARVRTNEADLGFAQGGAQWNLREFHPSNGHLELTTVEDTPDDCLNGSASPLPSPCTNTPARLGQWANANALAVKSDHYDMPLTYPTSSAPFLGGDAPALEMQTFWSAPGLSDGELRHHLSLGTCNGCHSRETDTVSMHIANTAVYGGTPAVLSHFLVGQSPSGSTPVSVVDPLDASTSRSFRDLDRRAQALSQAATLPCLCDLQRNVSSMTH